MTVRFTAGPLRAWRAPRRLVGVALATTALAAATSCSPKMTAVDDGFTTLEGIPTNDAKLVVWRDAPSYSYVYDDHAPVDPDTSDRIVSTTKYQRYDDNTIHGMIFDQTVANRFEGFRRESNGGLREFVVYRMESSVKWLETETEVYHFVDRAPSTFRPPTYVARGIVGGVVNPESPVTNYGSDPLPTQTNITANAQWKGTATAGRIELTWSAVPNADRYLIQVFLFRADIPSVDEKILSGTPAPIYDGKATDLFVATAASTVTEILTGNRFWPPGGLPIADPSRTDLQIFRNRPLAFGGEYIVRVSAYDAEGRMIGITYGLDDPIEAFLHHQMGIEKTLNQYMLYRLSGVMSFLETRGGGGSP